MATKLNAKQLMRIKEAYGIITTNRGGKIKSDTTKVDISNNLINVTIEFNVRNEHVITGGRVLIDSKTLSNARENIFPLVAYKGDKITLELPIEVVCQ